MTVPERLTIAEGSQGASFPISASVSAIAGLVTVTARLGSAVRNVVLDVGPPRIAGVTLDPTTVRSGVPATGTVRLDVSPPGGPVTVGLTSSDPTVAQVAATTSVEAGFQWATFPVQTYFVASPRSVSIQAILDTSSATGTLTVTPPSASLSAVAPGVVLPGAQNIVVYGSDLGASTQVLLSGPAIPLGGSSPVCNIRGETPPFCPETTVVATPSTDGRSLRFDLPSGFTPGSYFVESLSGQELSSNGKTLLVEEARKAYAAIPAEDHKWARRIYPGQTVEGVLEGAAPNCPYGATDYNQYFFLGRGGRRST